MKRAALYVRVSTQEQKSHGLSIENQIQALNEYCIANAIQPYKVYNDAGLSGHASYKKRPALMQLIHDCQEGKIDIILFTRIDRWFRSIKDYYLVMDQINVPWRAIWEDYNTETSDGQFKVNIMLSISEAEAARTSEKVKSVLAYKKEQGRYHGSVPFGYRLEDGHLYIIPEMVPLMTEVYDTYIATRSSSAVSALLMENGYNVSLNTVKRILLSTTYYGDANGVPCEAYITKETYDKVQSVKKHWARSTGDHVYMFGGICRCSICGRKLRSVHHKVDGGIYSRYTCRGWEGIVKHKSFSLSEIKIEKYLLDSIEEEMDKYRVEQYSSQNKDIKDISKEKKKLEARLERIGIRFEDGDITVEEYREKKAEIKRQLDDLSDEAPHEPVALPSGWREIYADMDKRGKKEFWASIIKCMEFKETNVESMKIEWI